MYISKKSRNFARSFNISYAFLYVKTYHAFNMINKLDNKAKVTLRYAAYIIGWSIGLFFSAFLFMFLPEESDAHMSFAEIFEDSNNIIQNYVYPMVIIMLLFHWDAIYSTFSTDEKNMSVASILLLNTFFFVGFLVCLMIGSIGWRIVGFIIAWVSLTFFKTYVVCCTPPQNTHHKGHVPDSGNI